MIRQSILAALLVATLLIGSSSLMADEHVLGANGELHSLSIKVLKDVRPKASALAANNPILCLETVDPTGKTIRQIVPGTAGAEPEAAPALLFEASSEALFVLWEERTHGIYSRLNLTSLTADGWSPVVEVSGNPFSLKTSPRLSVSRDSLGWVDAAGTSKVLNRTIVHLLWAEQTPNSLILNTLYSPLVFLDGAYVGSNTVFRVSDLVDPTLLGAAVSGLSSTGAFVPMLEEVPDGAGAQVGFVDAETGRLVAIEIDIVDPEVSAVADGARQVVVAQPPGQSGVTLGDVVASFIIDTGIDMHPALRSEIAKRSRLRIRELVPAGGLDKDGMLQLGQVVASFIIDTGVALDNIDRPHLARAAHRSVAADVPGNTPAAALGLPIAPATILDIAVLADWELPEVPGVVPSLMMSRHGDRALLSWETPTAVHYVETNGKEWTDSRSITLTGSIDLPKANEILLRHIREN